MLLGGDEPDVVRTPQTAPAEPGPSRLSPRWTPGHVPGEAGLWFFIFGDLLVFGLFFGVFMVERGDSLQTFRDGRESLDTALGVANTLLLLIGSMLVALGMRAIRMGRGPLAARLLQGAMVTGALFVVNKAVEYGGKFADDVGPTTNEFYTLYFGFTGIHLVHLLIGMAALTAMVVLARRPQRDDRDVALMESGATFWHLVDLLWLVLFPLFYLVA
jgi:nitric oxide reductase NorE protein